MIIPWTMYLSYGDTRILENQYDSMKAWVEYMRRQAGETHLWNTGFHFGDWLAFATHALGLPGRHHRQGPHRHRLLRPLHRPAAAGRRRSWATPRMPRSTRRSSPSIKKAFQREFVTAAGRVGENTQTAYALALQFDLLPEDLRAEAARRLAEEVRTRGHLTTGFVGTPYLCHVLSRHGHLDVAYQLLNRKEYPSWLYPVTQGATTIWERWDGQKPDGSFQDVGMNSFNHYAYGAIGEWMYRVVAGLEIDPREPGYRHVLAQPQPGGGLTSADARLDTLYGPTRSAWALTENERLQVSVTVPPNTRGTVRLPGAVLDDVREGAQPVASAPGVRSASQGDGAVVVEVGSGEYRFTYPAGELVESLRSARYHVDETVAVLLASPEALAVIETHLPGFSTHAMISTMKPLTLREAMVLSEAPEGSLQKIDEELRQIPE